MTATHLVAQPLDVVLCQLLAVAQMGDPLVLLCHVDHDEAQVVVMGWCALASNALLAPCASFARLRSSTCS